MKRNTIKLTALTLGLLLSLAFTSAIAQTMVHGMIPAGSCSLPAGRYMLTNMNSGHALYVEINSQGKMFAQDPRKVNFTATSTSTPTNTVLQQPSATTTSTTAPTATSTSQTSTTPQPTSGSVWSGLLKQGVNSLLAPNQTPAQ